MGSDGYLKLIDFGFARRLRAGEKACTLCLTLYPNPNQGHDLGLDWWGVGALTLTLTLTLTRIRTLTLTLTLTLTRCAAVRDGRGPASLPGE